MSGDAYTARKIDEFQTFYLIVDGMGKGLSASLTTMIMTSFVNHMIDKMIEHDHFDLHLLVHETMSYIKVILLDEEALAIDYILIDDENSLITYAKFAMPVLLMQNSDDEIIRLKSNNPPMSKFQDDFKVSMYNIKEIKKFLFYTDGIVENMTIYPNQTYADFIEEDFKHSFTKKEFTDKLFEKLSEQEDDFSLAFVHKLDFNKKTSLEKATFDSSLKEIDKAQEWYEATLQSVCSNKECTDESALTFSELFMNAYEHGNLGINSKTKHRLIQSDTYLDRLIEEEKKCSKKITVSVIKIKYFSSEYFLTKISDEGDGFDTQILSQIFRNSKQFNGRGVFISRKNSMGIYYNAKGNTVLFLNKISTKE